MNRVVLVGHLTKDPELRTSGNNISVANFTIAINRPFSNQNGEREADFINCIVWRKQAENLKNYTKKGSLVAVDGRIQTRNYTANDGTKRYVTEVVADTVQFLTPKGSSINQSQNDNNDYNNIDPMPTTDIDNDPYVDFGSSIELTDDLPF